MSIIKNLINSGVIQLYHDYRAGHFTDLSGNGNSGTPTTVVFNNRGIQLSAATSKVVVTHKAALVPTTGSIIVYGDFSNQYFSKFVDKSDGTNMEYNFYPASTTLMGFRYAITNLTYTIDIRQKKYLAVNFTTGNTPTMWADGVLQGSFSGACTITPSTNNLTILNDGSGTRGSLYNTMGAVIICNRELTATEHARLYSELSNYNWMQKRQSKSASNIKVESTFSGLAAGWDMKPAGSSIPDISGNGYTGTIVGNPIYQKTAIGDAMYFDGSTQYIQSAILGTSCDADNMSGSIWFKTTSNASMYLMGWWGGGATYQALCRISTGDPYVTFYNDSTAVNASATATLDDGAWHHFFFNTSDYSIKMYIDNVLLDTETYARPLLEISNASSFAIGARRIAGTINSYFSGWLASPRIFNKALSAVERTALYEEGKNALYKTDWGAKESIAAEGGTVGAYLNNTPFQFGDTTARYKISTTTINSLLCKVIECTVAGLLYVPTSIFNQNSTEACYGTWDFWIYKGADANTSNVVFVGSSPTDIGVTANGYKMTYNSTEGFAQYRLTGGVNMVSANDLYPILTWHHVKITRSSNGAFTSYINDSLLVAASGTNPVTNTLYTTAPYFILDLDAGDKVAYSDSTGQISLIKKLIVN